MLPFMVNKDVYKEWGWKRDLTTGVNEQDARHSQNTSKQPQSPYNTSIHSSVTLISVTLISVLYEPLILVLFNTRPLHENKTVKPLRIQLN